MSTGENLLHVLNTLESRSVVLEAELRAGDDANAATSAAASSSQMDGLVHALWGAGGSLRTLALREHQRSAHFAAACAPSVS